MPVFLFGTTYIKLLDKTKENGIIKNALWYERLGSVAGGKPRAFSLQNKAFSWGKYKHLKAGIMANGGLMLQPPDCSIILRLRARDFYLSRACFFILLKGRQMKKRIQPPCRKRHVLQSKRCARVKWIYCSLMKQNPKTEQSE